MVANVTTVAQLSGEDQGFAAIRKTASKLANSGVVWAGLAVLGGWLLRRPREAMLAGVTGCLLALVVHYGTAELSGLTPGATVASNREWFIAAVVAGPPLGLVGALARRLDAWGLLARLVVPAGAVTEPFLTGLLSPVSDGIWANRVSSLVTGWVLVVGGVGLAILVVLRWHTPSVVGRSRARTVAATTAPRP